MTPRDEPSAHMRCREPSEVQKSRLHAPWKRHAELMRNNVNPAIRDAVSSQRILTSNSLLDALSASLCSKKLADVQFLRASRSSYLPDSTR